MKKNLLFIFFAFTLTISFGQIGLIENFDASTALPAGWTTAGYSGTAEAACAGNSFRDNLWNSSNTGNLTSPNLVASSNATDLSLSFDYKVVDFAAPPTTGTAPGWGEIIVQYSTDDGINWVNITTINDTNHVTSANCATINETILAADLPTGSDFKLQFVGNRFAGDYYIYFDNINALQSSTTPPNCDAVLTSPMNGDTATPIDGNITWSAATGIPTGYILSVGTTPGGTDILNGLDVGNVTTYALGTLLYDTTYYVTITSYNLIGNATGCIEESFMTGQDPSPNPPVGITCNTGSPYYVFSEDFEVDPAAGWTGTAFTGGNGDWDITAGNANSTGTGPFSSFSGGMHLEYEASGSSSIIATAISPAIDLTSVTDDAELSFYLHSFGADIGELNVGIGTSAGGPFTTVITIPAGQLQTSDTDAWLPIGTNLAAYIGQTIFVQFSYGGTGTGFEGDLSIDLIRVESCVSTTDLPNCNASLVTPLDGATAVDENTDITWSAATVFVDGYTLFIGTTPGGTDILNGLDVGNVLTYDPPAVLDSATTYYVTIIPYNGNGNATGCIEQSFTTRFVPTAPLGVTCNTGAPYFIFSEDFETDPAAGWTGTTFSGNNGDWDITVGNANSTGTGPFSSFSGGMHLEYEASGSSTNIATAITPAIDLTSVTDGAELSFYLHAFGDDIGTLDIAVGTSATGPFTSVFALSGFFQTADTDAWIPVGINLDAYIGQTIFIQFSYGGSGAGFEGDLSLDLIQVESCVSTTDLPNCNASLVTPLDGATAVDENTDITWSAATVFVDGYTLFIGTTPGGTDILNGLDVGNVLTYDPPAVLDSATTYYVTIIPYNGNGNATGCIEQSFTTRFVPTAPLGVTCNTGAPYFIFSEDFETDPAAGWTGTTFSGNNGDWDITVGNANSTGTGPFSSFSGGMHLEFEGSGSNTVTATAISPAIDLTTTTDSAELSFYLHAFGDDIGTLDIAVGTSATGPFTSVFALSGFFQTADTDAWIPVGINLDAYIGQTIFIQFTYGGAGTGFEADIALDLIQVESCIDDTDLPNCTSILNPLDGAIGVLPDVVINWNPATVLVSGYLINIGTSPGGTDVINGLDVGNVLTYDHPTPFAISTTHYITIIPYNNNGNAVGCMEQSFTTSTQTIIPIACANQTFTVLDGANFYDDGGPGGCLTQVDCPGNYADANCTTIITLCPPIVGDCQSVSVDFSIFALWNTTSSWDNMRIYDNDNTSGTVLFDNFAGGADVGYGTDGLDPPFSVTATNPTGCLTFEFFATSVVNRAGWEATVNVTTIPNADSSFTLSPTCDGATATITGDSGGVFSFNPIPTDGAIIDPATGTITAGTAGTTYTVDYTVDQCSFSSMNITVGGTDASFMLNPTCDGAVVSGIATPGGTFTFNPIPTDGATIDPVTGTITNGVSGTVYNVDYTTPGTCSSVGAQMVTVIVSPNADAPTNVSSCNDYILPALTTGNYFTGTGGTGTMLNAGDAVTSTQTIFVYAETGTTPNCTDENSFIVTIGNTIPVDILNDVSACDSYTLVALTNGNYFTATGGGGTALNAGDTVTTTQTIYIYVVDPSDPTCFGESSFVVTINTTPTADAPTNVTACDSYTLPALTVGNYFTATAGGGTALSAGDTVTSTQTIFVYAETATTPNCTDENSFVVTINATPTADAPANVSACDSYTLPALTVGNYFTATAGGGTALNAGDTVTTTQTIFVYAQTGTTPNCSDENSFVVTINTAPTADAPTNVTACDSYTLPALTVGNYFTATAGGGTALSAGDTVTSTQTIFVYAETATTPNCTDENSFVVTINATPTADAPTDVNACGLYTLPSLTVGNYFTATAGGGTALSAGDDITTSQTLFVYAQTGTTPNCSDENSFVVTINAAPTANPVMDIEACVNNNGMAEFDTSLVQSTLVGSQTGVTVTYTDENGGSLASPLPNPFVSSNQTITATVTNANNCTSSITFDLVYSNPADCEIFIPDGFSPNGDGVNDTFEIQNLAAQYPNYTIEFYNRWGTVVYETDITRGDWNGKLNGVKELVPIGIYYFIINFNDSNRAPLQDRLYISR